MPLLQPCVHGKLALLGKGAQTGQEKLPNPCLGSSANHTERAQALNKLGISHFFLSDHCAQGWPSAGAHCWRLNFKKLLPKLFSRESHPFSPQLSDPDVFLLIHATPSWRTFLGVWSSSNSPDMMNLICVAIQRAQLLQIWADFIKAGAVSCREKNLNFYEHLINLKTLEFYQLPPNWCALQTEPVKISWWACLEDERWHFSSCWFEMMPQEGIKNSAWSLPVFKNDTMS